MGLRVQVVERLETATSPNPREALPPGGDRADRLAALGAAVRRGAYHPHPQRIAEALLHAAARAELGRAAPRYVPAAIRPYSCPERMTQSSMESPPK